MCDLGIDSATLRYSGGAVQTTAEEMSQRLTAFQSELAAFGTWNSGWPIVS